MKQAEVFTHFVHGEHKSESKGSGAGAGAGAGGGKRGHHAMTEKDEDEELVEEGLGQQGGSAFKLSKQPSIVTGQMREYQLEGLNWMINLHDNNISGILAGEQSI